MPPSFIMRWPMKRAASRNVTSFIRFSACSGVLVRVSRTTQLSRSGGIEIHHHRRRHGALPEGVQTAAVEIRTFALVVVHVLHGELFPQAGRLVRLYRRTAELFDQQARSKQRLVAHHLRGQAKSRTSRQQAILRVALQQFRRGLARTAGRWRW